MNRRRKGLKPKEYGAIHTWLWKNYGKATYCENPDCQGRSTNYEWAMIHEKGYDFKRENFMMLCKSCHCIYDMDEETKEQISVTLTGRTLSNEHIQHMSESRLGHVYPLSRNKKISESKIGKPGVNINRKFEIVTCPHCNKSGGITGMKRWHFDNCKLKLTI